MFDDINEVFDEAMPQEGYRLMSAREMTQSQRSLVASWA
jgi:hypothetical protein